MWMWKMARIGEPTNRRTWELCIVQILVENALICALLIRNVASDLRISDDLIQ